MLTNSKIIQHKLGDIILTIKGNEEKSVQLNISNSDMQFECNTGHLIRSLIINYLYAEGFIQDCDVRFIINIGNQPEF